MFVTIYSFILKEKGVILVREYELTEEMDNISSLESADFAEYLTEEETMQIFKNSRKSAETLRKM